RSQYENRAASSCECDDGCESFSRRCWDLGTAFQRPSSTPRPAVNPAISPDAVDRGKSRKAADKAARPGDCTRSCPQDGSYTASPPSRPPEGSPWKAHTTNSSPWNPLRTVWSPI